MTEEERRRCIILGTCPDEPGLATALVADPDATSWDHTAPAMEAELRAALGEQYEKAGTETLTTLALHLVRTFSFGLRKPAKAS